MTAPLTPEALRTALVHACFDPGHVIGPRDGRTMDEWRADACMKQLAPFLAAHQQVTAERDEDRAELARLRAEGEAKDRALLLLLPFVDYAAGEGLAFVETEDGEHPEMDAADIMAAAAEALGLELGSDAYLALLPAGYDAIRAARAATAREGA